MAKFDLENFPTSESAKRMLGYVTAGFYDNSYVAKWLFQVMGLEYDEALKIAQELPDQFFPETATWGLTYHEVKWGLPVRTNLSYEERRRLVIEKRDCRAPITPYRMEAVIRNATGIEAEVADIHDGGSHGYVPAHPNVFRVFVEGAQDVELESVYETVNRVKQSHTTYELCLYHTFAVAVGMKRQHYVFGFELSGLYPDAAWIGSIVSAGTAVGASRKHVTTGFESAGEDGTECGLAPEPAFVASKQTVESAVEAKAASYGIEYSYCGEDYTQG